MLPLNDPLWEKLDDAHRDKNIPRLLCKLSENWQSDEATSLFWDNLCHQDTCYGATYAVVPHFIDMAETTSNIGQRLDIAVFLGHIAHCAFQKGAGCCGGKSGPELLQGVPSTLEGWHSKLKPYRQLVMRLEDPNRMTSAYEQNELLPCYRKILSIDPVNGKDLEKIHSIASEFHVLLPQIRSLCERAFVENFRDEHAPAYLLAGMASADSFFELARLLESGKEGWLACRKCA